MVITFALLLAGTLGALYWVLMRYPDAPHGGAGKSVAIEIERGMRLPEIARLLADNDVIDHPKWFRLYALRRGEAEKIRGGQYTFLDNQRPADVLAALVRGTKAQTVSVTLPEGQNLFEYAAALASANVVADANALIVLATTPAFLSGHGIAAPTAEGYLFPDTYNFRVGASPEDVLTKLIERHQQVWREVSAQHATRAGELRQALGWTDRELLILASIVEKEAVAAEERPRIAQVFINRLTSPTFQPKRLETDPTIRYGCLLMQAAIPGVSGSMSAGCANWRSTDRLRTAQLRDKANPYNTYEIIGLPPGPIANPGRASMAAALSPDGSKYFYFVAKNEREHVFSRTLAEHQAAVDDYQK